MNKVTVLGSLNVDTVLQISRFPKPGETLAIHQKSIAGGGKGANQGIAAARAGAETRFIGKVGRDAQGQFMLEQLRKSHVNTHLVRESETGTTGQAFIMVEDSGENRILIDGGTNQELTVDDILAAKSQIAESDFMVAQFETPLAVTQAAFKLAHEAGVFTILNPAPAKLEVSAELLALTDLIIPNETETTALTGITVTDEATMLQAAEAFQQQGVANAIITVGSRGAFYATKDDHGFVPAFKVNAKDSTAAGDSFIGALVSKLTPDLKNLPAAVKYANLASSIAVQRLGAQPSIPNLTEIEAAEKNL